MVRDTFIKVRVTEEERQRYLAASAERGKPLGVIIRESLDRMAKRIEREKAAK